ncbi:echinoderm microtubule-associated protein-like CG42247 isoform X1 [Aphidius gifuensis]|uniref:echinoderm microtubule-associated protein-like CG42247 isoform X1 n=2 Tax=Aphidius gifuensis TaxID=684658 RepID=UPI001CDBBAB4|nr:echinoderm microtubule-associated protein-like CG42247 isoform X1 [Aphidius gifuensis]
MNGVSIQNNNNNINGTAGGGMSGNGQEIVDQQEAPHRDDTTKAQARMAGTTKQLGGGVVGVGGNSTTENGTTSNVNEGHAIDDDSEEEASEDDDEENEDEDEEEEEEDSEKINNNNNVVGGVGVISGVGGNGNGSSGARVVEMNLTSGGGNETARGSQIGMEMGTMELSSGSTGGGGMGGYWRHSRPSSPRMPPPEQTEQRPKSRHEQIANATTRYNNLGYWRARRVTFYKNGDPYFPGVEFRFKPGRDIGSLEALLDRLSLRLDLPRGARHIFSMDGDRKLNLDELEDGASYVVSSYKTFKPASYGKKNNTWYTAPGGVGGGGGGVGASRGSIAGGGWQSRPAAVASLSRKASITEEAPPPGGGKPSSGRVIRIVNNLDHTVQCRVLLNLRTSQPFEEVLEDLGQVLKMNGAKRMFTVSGQEVRSFSQLRNEFADVDTFYLGTGAAMGMGASMVTSSPARRSRSRGPSIQMSDPIGDIGRQRRARSKSRPRALYAPDSEVVRVNDYSVVEVLREEPARVTIRGLRRSFYPPSHLPLVDNSPPDKKLQLEWVYGYRGTDTRRNLWVLPSGELLYYVAAVAVLFDREENSQRHYVGHTEDITCMEVHPSRELVASGQKAGRHRKAQPHVRIWSTETLLTLYVFGMTEFQMGVSALAFSQLNGGSYVLVVDAGREAILSVWQWQWGHLLGKVATLQEDLTGAAFHPLDDNLLITHGRGHLTFWNRRKDGFFERTDIIKPPSRTHVTSIQFEQDGDVVTADSDGFITVYSVDADGAYFVRMEFEAHNKGISSLVMLSEGTLLSGGEKDRKIAAWDSLQNYKRITDTKLPETAGGVRSIYPQRPGRNDGNIYVGTTRNNILEGSLQRRFNQVVFGHGRQLWGLAVHPDDEVFATAGHDKNIALWRRHKLLWTTQVGFECICIAFHPFGVALAAGSSEGHLLVLAADTGAAVATLRVCGSSLSCIGYNPTGEIIAMGSQNGSIYLFRVSRDGFSYKKSNKIRGTQPLVQLDWSSDSRFLQTVTQDYDLVFWDIKALQSEKSPIVMKDVKWHTHNCTVGYMVSGMWNNRYYPLTTVLTTSSRSAAHDMLVSGDAEGYLRLFRYPCTSAKAEYVEEKVYSSLLACARFLYNDQNIVTVGGTDAALMLWELVDE